MTLVLENGSGVAGANAFADADFADAYFTARGRSTEGGWSTATPTQKGERLIIGAAHIENRFRLQFKGSKQLTDISRGRSTITFTGQPANAETVVVGSVTYRFVTILSSANDVLIDTAKLTQTIKNLVDAINGDELAEGTTIGAGTTQHPDVVAQTFYGFSALIVAKDAGPDSQFIATTTTAANGSWNFATLNGGRDFSYPQPLSFPRFALYDRDGIRIYGIPDALKAANCEYAIRAGTEKLSPDVTIDATGRSVTRKREKVGPIETETEYSGGSGITYFIRPYPEADRLLQEFLGAAGRVIR